MTLAKALRKAAGFIRAIEVSADSSDVLKKAKVPGNKNFNCSDRNPGSRERRPPFEAVDPRFTTDAEVSSWWLEGTPCFKDCPI